MTVIFYRIRWTLTLDVLKLISFYIFQQSCYGWTLTLDVLKSRGIDFAVPPGTRWTLTLDVLKCGKDATLTISCKADEH